jgi:hypothetical protein
MENAAESDEEGNSKINALYFCDLFFVYLIFIYFINFINSYFAFTIGVGSTASGREHANESGRRRN